jgi:chondroitin synthase
MDIKKVSNVQYHGCANDYALIDKVKEDMIGCDYGCLGVSVVIPYFDNIDRLLRTLSGLQDQTFPVKNIEVLVCDDGSKEDITELLKAYQDNFRAVRYLRNSKKGFGLSKVRNIGILNASFDLVVLLDDDMIPCEDMVFNHVSVVRTGLKVISVGFRHHKKTYEIEASDLKKKYEPTELDWRVNNTDIQGVIAKIKYSNYFSWSFVSGGNLAFDRTSVNKLILFNEDFDEWGGEDNEWAYRLYKEGYYFYPNFDAIAIHQDSDTIIDKKTGNLKKLFSLLPTVKDFYKNPNYKPSDTPLVSFWMCNNNRGKYIQDAIKSILKFPYRFEIVVVDDGSEDNSVSKVLELNVPNLTLLKIPKNTLGYAYKTALDHCRGEYLVQLDSDDFISNLAGLVDMIIFAMNSHYGLVYGHHYHVDESGNYLSEGWKYPECDRRKMLFNSMLVHPPRIIKKRDYSRSRPIDITLESAVDYDLYSKILEVADGFFFDVDMYAYRQHDKSVTANRLDSQKNNVAKIIRDRLIYFGIFDKCTFDDTIKRSCVVQSSNFDPLDVINKSRPHK